MGIVILNGIVINNAGTTAGNIPASTSGATISSGSIAYYDAGNSISYPGSGSTWKDLSGNNNNVTLSGAYSYNASGYITFPGNAYGYNNSNILSKSAYTKQAWVKFSTFATENNIISGADTNPGPSQHAFWLSNSNGILQAGHNNVWNRVIAPSTPALSTGTWYNLTVTYSNTNGWVLYTNGQQKATNSNTETFSGTGLYQIGAYNGLYYLKGDVAIALIYNRALTLAEVQQNYNTDKARFGY